ncbi:MAG: hypothetical protein IJY50_00750 [Clostridia bacterium]|nr:hypothetical protein [Clostridia bacterium]
MKFTRILSLVLALLMVAALFVACDEEPVEETPDTEPTETTLNIITAGITDYVIVRDYNAAPEIIAAVNEIVQSIKLNIGADIAVKECFSDREEASDIETEKEILVGMTNRQESIDALSGMRSQDWTISVHGSKLVIGGGGDDGTYVALTKFVNDIVAEQGNRFAVKQGELQNLVYSTKNNINFTATYSYSSAHMLGVRIDSFCLIRPKNDDEVGTYAKFAEELSTYISTQAGYDLGVYKSSRRVGDYEILIGDCSGNPYRIDHGMCECEQLGDDEYVIKLVKTTDNYNGDETEANGGQLYICFGKNARDAAFKAFTEQIMPATSSATTFTLEDGFVLTNKK